MTSKIRYDEEEIRRAATQVILSDNVSEIKDEGGGEETEKSKAKPSKSYDWKGKRKDRSTER